MADETTPNFEFDSLPVDTFEGVLSVVQLRFLDAFEEQQALTSHRTFTVRDARPWPMARFMLGSTHILNEAEMVELAVPIKSYNAINPELAISDDANYFWLWKRAALARRRPITVNAENAATLVFGEEPVVPDLPRKIKTYTIAPIRKTGL